MSEYQRSDGWEALRARVEASSKADGSGGSGGSGGGFRGGWVPRRRGSWTVPPPPHSLSSPPESPPDHAAGTTAVPRLSPSHLAVGALASLVALVATLVVLWSAQPREQSVPLAAQATASAALDPTSTPALPPTPAPTLPPVGDPGAPAAGPEDSVEVVVHVAGKVRQPGVIRLPAGSRVIDAVEAAGGARAGADLSTVNLARALQDGEQVRIGLPPDATVAGIDGASGATAEAEGPSSPIDLNTAGADALESLPGVGPVLAERIIAYREESGGFRSVDQLVEVPGIGPAVLGGLAGLVRV